jgi:hypothetical protein
MGLTVLVMAVAVLSLGCMRGLVSPTAPAGDQIYMAKPLSVPAGIISSDCRSAGTVALGPSRNMKAVETTAQVCSS